MNSEELHEPSLNYGASKVEAAAFVRALVRWVGPGFHPDTDFNAYVKGDSKSRSYTTNEAARLNAKLNQAIATLRQGEEDVYDIAAPVQHSLLSAYFGGDSVAG